MIFEVFESPTNKLWYFHLKTANGEIVTASEGYHNRSDIESLWEKYFHEWRWSERNYDDTQRAEGTEEGSSPEG